MPLVLAILFAVIVIWLLRELVHSRDATRIDSALDALADNKELGIVPARFRSRVAKVATEQNHHRRQRELAEANLQILLSSMEDGVMVVDSRHSIRLVNQSLRKTFDLDAHT